ncbi:MAG TPA: amino acid adenylation domain-containing protein [Candidatus Dormibacteraeota bacterium]|nr:amino acid adenylation domain-containing protein [Candidatus Dormibacteraeota bacterium]
MSHWNPHLEGIAIIGLSARLPGARNVAEFWRNQRHGVEAISHFRPDELEVPDWASLGAKPNYVLARSILDDADKFDAAFFGIYPREAELMDPQHRVFLECCWEVFEDSGYDPQSYPGAVAVFAGCSQPTYFYSQLLGNPEFRRDYTGGYQVGNYPAMMGNGLDFLATRVAYKFNLRGPAFSMVAGCSTSLLATCQACQSLLTYQADMAIAGGVSITFPQKRGSFYQEGGMTSPDGHCRTFDADAQGTVFGAGAAVVLLKRLEDAMREGDQIYAVIRGFGMNNDGSAKVGYTAPSIDGQSRVIAMAQEAAGIEPRSIGYIEAHGTGTPLGDPIELAALAQAFRAKTKDRSFCAVGTAKTNLGHLDIAAGATGLIHAALIVKHGELVPTLHFHKPNPKFDIENSPFFVNTKLREWKPEEGPRRAGVSAFGVGGTNAHVILEQAPERASGPASRTSQLIVLSARSAAALDAVTDRLAEHLRSDQFRNNSDPNFADAVFTLHVGRKYFEHRRILVSRSPADAATALASREPKRVISRNVAKQDPALCFMFPGQGSQQLNMGRALYDSEPLFREQVDLCAKLLQPSLGCDLRTQLYPSGDATEEASDKITQTILAQPTIFTIEYALAKLWMSWGITPRFMIGHSVGEFVAACLAGVFSLSDALQLIAARGRMMQGLPRGAMLSVRLAEADVRSLLRKSETLSLAAVNAPALCVVAGPTDDVARLEEELTCRNVVHRRLQTSHAFHSSMMDPILEPFIAECKKIRLSAPSVPYLSGVSGNWITAEEATDPVYWAHHFREAVRFSPGIAQLRDRDDCILLEVGPGNVLATLARQHPAKSKDQIVVSSLTDGTPQISETDAVLQALGSLWLGGVQPNWKAFHADEQRIRVSLPTYPFERQRFWLEDPAPEYNGKSNQEDASEASKSSPASQAEPAAPASSPSEWQEIAMTQAHESAVSKPNRKEKLLLMLAEIFQDLSGVDASAVDKTATFTEMGFDSLFLTQVTQALQSKFKIKITFRQLSDQQSTLERLAAYLDEKLSPEAYNEPAPTTANPLAAAPRTEQHAQAPSNLAQPAAVVNATAWSAPPGSTLEQLFRDQLQAMNQLFAQQLAAVRGTGLTQITSTPEVSPLASMPSPALPNAAANVEPVKELKGFTPFKPLQKNISGELTPKQESYIRALIERYTTRTSRSKAKTQEYRQFLADPRVVSGFRLQWKEMIYPIITVRSEGSHLWDLDGNEYVDILNGFGPIMLGHRPEYVQNAIEKQLREGFEIGSQTLLAGEVAQAICEMTGNERATFCNTGSEAVIAAMRVARTVTGRSKVVFFSGDYHGMFDEVLVKGIKKQGEPLAVPVAPGIPREKAANVVVLEYGVQGSLDWIRKNAGELAAVMVEPVQSRHPDLQPVSFLKEVRAITQESGACLIFDEVVTGFRVHPGGCQALFDIRADLVTYGKVLAGGMPIGVLAGKAEYMDALDGGIWQYGDDSFPSVGVTFFAGTFVRHPLAMAACAAVLKHLKEQGPTLQQRLNERSAVLAKRLNALLEKNQVPTRIENFASIFYFSFPSGFRFGSLFYYHLREKGIHALEGFPCFLTTAHTDADIERIYKAFAETIAEMQAGDALPTPATGSSTSESETNPAAAEPAVAIASSPPAAHGLTQGEAPITESQMEILLSAQLSPEANCSYNESFSLHLRGELNEPAFHASLQELINRHDGLRALFNLEDQKQLFVPVELDLALVNLAGLSAAQQQAQYDALGAQDAGEPFDLINGPLIRARLIRFLPEHHVLMFTAHHIVCDGWSVNVLLDELSRLYNARCAGTRCELDRLMSFSAYAQAQKLHYESSEGHQNEEYWTRQFATLPPPLNLPIDRARPTMKSFAGATYRKRIDAAAYKKIKRAGAQQKCTLFVTLVAGFHVLLSRLCAQEDIAVGIPAAGQSLVEDKTLVGHCVNFVPLRGNVAGDLSMAQFLEQIRKNLLDAYEHQNYTYGRLVRKLSIPRDPSRLPLLEVQFNLERVGTGLKFQGLEVVVDSSPKRFVNFDLFLNVVEGDDGLVLDLDYNTILLDEATIASWLDSYEALLLGMAQDASQKISHLPLLSEAQQQQVVFDGNQTAADYPRNKCVHRLFEERVFEQGAGQGVDATALVFEEKSFTYAELNSRANQLARYLVRLGVQPGGVVGVYIERSLEMVVALLGVWKAGAAYVPLDPTFPRERIAFVFEDTAPRVVLTQVKLAADLPPSGVSLVCLDQDWTLIEREAATNLDIPYDPARIAYTIYTSGSTGKPKGVEVTHRNVVNVLHSMAKTPGLDARDTLAAVTTISFDIAALELFLPLITGAKLVLASRAVASDGQQLLDLLKGSGATVMQATPVSFRLLLDAGWKGDPKLKVLCGGEALPRELANRILACGVPVWNMYGPTETTIWSATIQVEESDGPVTIGPPISNTQFYVLDANGQPVPPGVPGELCIGGDGVARGYYNRPELTAQKFIPDTFRKEPAARLYRTGDLVRRRSDGSFDFLGRMDDQIKLRGFRIELGEIESGLAAHPAIKEAVAAVREDVPGEKRLVAYMIPANGSIPSASELRSFLSTKLPDYMVPAAFVRLSRFPLTLNGKVDRRALPAPDWDRQTRGTSYAEPRTPEEKIMTGIWAEVLHLERVGINDNLFELGADSLHVFQIVARANKAGIDVKPRQILQHRTIAAVFADLAKSNSVSSGAPALAPVSRSKYRLTRQPS